MSGREKSSIPDPNAAVNVVPLKVHLCDAPAFDIFRPSERDHEALQRQDELHTPH